MTYTFLALGDSYTIGEQVLLTESFPYQTVQYLRKGPAGSNSFAAPEVIAKTGWTTDELDKVIQQITLLKQYDIVTLLIGVNNQYRGRSVDEFKNEFTQLLHQAIEFAGADQKRVFVLSIPDWGVTPFAAGRDLQKIAGEIDLYNEACKKQASAFHCTYIDITDSQRKDGANPEFLAADGLHPSALEYKKWAKQLSDAIHVNLV